MNLVRDNTVTIHKRNLRKLAIGMYKISNNLSRLFTREIMTEICVPYNMISTTKVEENDSGSFQCTKRCNYEIITTKTVFYGLESIRYLGPDEMKELKVFRTFQVKSVKFEDCPCKLWKNYFQGVGYFDLFFHRSLLHLSSVKWFS